MKVNWRMWSLPSIFGKIDLPFWDDMLITMFHQLLGVCFFVSAARDSRSIHGSFVRIQKFPPFLGKENWLPADFKAPKVDRKVGLQNLGCQLGTVPKMNKDKQTVGGGWGGLSSFETQPYWDHIPCWLIPSHTGVFRLTFSGFRKVRNLLRVYELEVGVRATNGYEVKGWVQHSNEWGAT